RVRNGWSPAKRRVPGQEGRRNVAMIEVVETTNDRLARVRLVITRHFIVRQMADDGNRPVKMVRVRGAEARDLAAGLRPDRGVMRMRVYDAADRLECAIKREMRRQI